MFDRWRKQGTERVLWQMTRSGSGLETVWRARCGWGTLGASRAATVFPAGQHGPARRQNDGCGAAGIHCFGRRSGPGYTPVGPPSTPDLISRTTSTSTRGVADMKVPFYGHVRQYHSIQQELDAAIKGVLESSQYVMGPALQQFERDLAGYSGMKHAVGVNSGTDALWLAFLALGIRPGDEIVTVGNTFFA